jgi:hypothetical protein
MFGSVPLGSLASTSTKLHYFRTPAHILITKLFTLPSDLFDNEELESHFEQLTVQSIKSRNLFGSTQVSPTNTISINRPNIERSILDPEFFTPVGESKNASPTSSIASARSISELMSTSHIQRLQIYSAENDHILPLPENLPRTSSLRVSTSEMEQK